MKNRLSHSFLTVLCVVSVGAFWYVNARTASVAAPTEAIPIITDDRTADAPASPSLLPDVKILNEVWEHVNAVIPTVLRLFK